MGDRLLMASHSESVNFCTEIRSNGLNFERICKNTVDNYKVLNNDLTENNREPEKKLRTDGRPKSDANLFQLHIQLLIRSLN